MSDNFFWVTCLNCLSWIFFKRQTICHKSADVWKYLLEGLLFWSLCILMCPYKNRTNIFNPTKEKPVYSLDTHLGHEHHKWGGEKWNSQWLLCLGAEIGGQVGFSRTIQVGVGSFPGFTYKSLLCPLGPVHAMSHLVDRWVI